MAVASRTHGASPGAPDDTPASRHRRSLIAGGAALARLGGGVCDARTLPAQAQGAGEVLENADSAGPDAELLALCGLYAQADDALAAVEQDRSCRRLPADDPRVLAHEDALSDAMDWRDEVLEALIHLPPHTARGIAAKAGVLRRNLRHLLSDPALGSAHEDDDLGIDDRATLIFLEQLEGGAA